MEIARIYSSEYKIFKYFNSPFAKYQYNTTIV